MQGKLTQQNSNVFLEMIAKTFDRERKAGRQKKSGGPEEGFGEGGHIVNAGVL